MSARRTSFFFALALSVGLGCGASSSTAPPPGTPEPATTTLATETPAPLGETGWEQIRDEDGILVWRKEVPGSPVVAFRGEGDIDAPIAVVASILMDLEHSNEWIHRLVEARVLVQLSDTEYLTYSHLGAPIMVSDRDFVNQAHVDFEPPDRIEFNLHSVEDSRAPVTDFVRGKMLLSRFELHQTAPGKTHVRCEIHADPMGSIPKWIVNHFQKSWAFNTITQLRLQAAKPGIAERAPPIRALLARHGFTM